MEDCGVVVIDIGSYSSKVGYAGDDNPKVVFPTTVGHSKHPGHTVNITHPSCRNAMLCNKAIIIYSTCIGSELTSATLVVVGVAL